MSTPEKPIPLSQMMDRLKALEQDRNRRLFESVLDEVNRKYTMFCGGNLSNMILYTGDFVPNTAPLQLRIPTWKPEFNFSYNDFLKQLLEQQVGHDRIGEPVETSRLAVAEVKFSPALKEISESNPHKRLFLRIEQTRVASPRGEARGLYFYRYQESEFDRFPITETIIVRRFKKESRKQT